MNQEFVILVDEFDNELGTMEKMEAHEKALLHRAFSVLIYNSKGEMLLQQRAHSKYHSAGLWTNACCSHPRAGETTAEAAHRRLSEELGFDCDLTLIQSFIYKAPFDNGLTEHELDHIFNGKFEGEIWPNPEEVSAIRWVEPKQLMKEIEKNPEQFTVWFKMILTKVNITA